MTSLPRSAIGQGWSGWWIVSIEIIFYASGAPVRCRQFGPRAGRRRRPAVLANLGHRAVPFGDQRERIRGAIGLIAASLGNDHGRVQAGLLTHVAVVRPGSDQGAAALAGHARVPS